MKDHLRILTAVLLTTAVTSQAQVIFFDDFDAYSNGNLVGQGDWLQNGTIATTPIQVAAGTAVLVSGQDANKALLAPFSWTASGSAMFNFGATINVASATTTGDYFLHWSPATGSTVFISRLYAKADGGNGFLLGYVETSGTGASLTYGTQSLSFGQNYDVVIKYSAIPSAPDTAEVFVNGMSYLTDVWTSTLAETTTLGAVNLRQGGSTAAAAVSVDNLFVQVVPEPASATLLGLGLAGLLVARRRS